MLHPDKKAELTAGFRKATIVWGAMFACLAIYVVVAHIMASQTTGGIVSGFPVDTVRAVLYAVSALELALSFFIRRFMLATHRSPPGLAAAPVETGSYATSEVAKYLAAVVVSNAIVASIAVYGLALSFLGAGFNTLYAFVGVCAAAMLIHRPRLNEIYRLAEDMRVGS